MRCQLPLFLFSLSLIEVQTYHNIFWFGQNELKIMFSSVIKCNRCFLFFFQMLLPCLLCLVITYQWGCFLLDCSIFSCCTANPHVLLMNIWKTMYFKRPGVQTSVPLDVESVFVYRFCLILMGRFKSLLGKKTNICLLVIACKENFRQDSSEVRLQWPLCCNNFACSWCATSRESWSQLWLLSIGSSQGHSFMRGHFMRATRDLHKQLHSMYVFSAFTMAK